jgi:hypothetical protein
MEPADFPKLDVAGSIPVSRSINQWFTGNLKNQGFLEFTPCKGVK